MPRKKLSKFQMLGQKSPRSGVVSLNFMTANPRGRKAKVSLPPLKCLEKEEKNGGAQ